jgi:hypothetical protein
VAVARVGHAQALATAGTMNWKVCCGYDIAEHDGNLRHVVATQPPPGDRLVMACC